MVVFMIETLPLLRYLIAPCDSVVTIWLKRKILKKKIGLDQQMDRPTNWRTNGLMDWQSGGWMDQPIDQKVDLRVSCIRDKK